MADRGYPVGNALIPEAFDEHTVIEPVGSPSTALAG